MRFVGVLLCTVLAWLGAGASPAEACSCMRDEPEMRLRRFPRNGHFFVGTSLELVNPGSPGFWGSPDGWRALTFEDLDALWLGDALTPDLTRRGERKVPTVVFRPKHGADVSAAVVVHGEGWVILEVIPRGFLQADKYYEVLADGERMGHVVTGTAADDEPPVTGRVVSASYDIGDRSSCSMGPYMRVELEGLSDDAEKFEVWVDSPDSAVELIPAFEGGFDTGPDACGWGHYELPAVGRHTLFFRAVDAAGNRGATSSVAFEAKPDHFEIRRLRESAEAWSELLVDMETRHQAELRARLFLAGLLSSLVGFVLVVLGWRGATPIALVIAASGLNASVAFASGLAWATGASATTGWLLVVTANVLLMILGLVTAGRLSARR